MPEPPPGDPAQPHNGTSAVGSSFDTGDCISRPSTPTGQTGRTVDFLPAASDPAAETLPPDSTVPGFRIEGVLGRGGMGVVYQARQEGLNRSVALKMVLAGAHASAEEKQRFLAEAAAVARLQHSNIVQVHAIGTHDGSPYFALELCSGGSLRDRLRGEPQPPRVAAELVAKLARAMHSAHAAGVIHRDLKPANVLFDGQGEPKVTDFGLAKQGDQDLTVTGQVMGTPSYMAPEQVRGEARRVSAATDA